MSPRLPLPLPLARRPRRGLPTEPGPLFAPIVVPAPAAPAPPSSPPSPILVGHTPAPARPAIRERWTVWRDRIDVEAGLAWIRRRHPEKTAEHLAAETGIPLDTAAKMLARETLPRGSTLLVMLAVYGPDFQAALYSQAPAWLVEAAQASHLAYLEAQLAADEAALARRRRELAKLSLEALRAEPAAGSC